MKLYYSPLACSLADHIALLEAGVPFEREAVDLKTKHTASGADFATVTRKGYVPALVLDGGEILTENIAVLDWIASQYPALRADGPLGRMRTLEARTYISTEIHRAFKPMWHQGTEEDKAKASRSIAVLLDLFAAGLETDYLFGDAPGVADFYLSSCSCGPGASAFPFPSRSKRSGLELQPGRPCARRWSTKGFSSP